MKAMWKPIIMRKYVDCTRRRDLKLQELDDEQNIAQKARQKIDSSVLRCNDQIFSVPIFK